MTTVYMKRSTTRGFQCPICLDVILGWEPYYEEVIPPNAIALAIKLVAQREEADLQAHVDSHSFSDVRENPVYALRLLRLLAKAGRSRNGRALIREAWRQQQERKRERRK